MTDLWFPPGCRCGRCERMEGYLRVQACRPGGQKSSGRGIAQLPDSVAIEGCRSDRAGWQRWHHWGRLWACLPGSVRRGLGNVRCPERRLVRLHLQFHGTRAHLLGRWFPADGLLGRWCSGRLWKAEWWPLAQFAPGGGGGGGAAFDGNTEGAGCQSVISGFHTKSVGRMCPLSTNRRISASDSGPCC